jgi:dTMP kinase
MPGRLIVLYGINNLGKSTQAKKMVDRLKAEGHQAEYLKYPIYEVTPFGPMINDYLRNGNPEKLSPREAQLIYALDRTKHQPELIQKLSQGIHMIVEDYWGTGMAWGFSEGLPIEFSAKINSHLIKEDIAFLFDGDRFLNSKEIGHRHEDNTELIDRVRQIHLDLGQKYNWHKINANLTIDEIHEILWAEIKKML